MDLGRNAARAVLLVEDEPLIAIMMKEALDEIGLEVIGPIGTIAAALDAAKQKRFDAAILDVNLDGQPIFPVADALAARNIPFAFVTGYSADRIDRHYAQVPVLEKPIEPEALQQLLLHGPLSRGCAEPGQQDGDPGAEPSSCPPR